MKPVLSQATVVAMSMGVGLAVGYLAWNRSPASHNRAAPDEMKQRLEHIEALLLASSNRQPDKLYAPLSMNDRSVLAALHSEVTAAVDAALEKQDCRTKTSAAAEQNDPSEPTPEQVQELRRGQEVIASALARQRWGDEEATEMRRVFSSVDSTQHDALMRVLLPAINSGKLKIQTSGRPF